MRLVPFLRQLPHSSAIWGHNEKMAICEPRSKFSTDNKSKHPDPGLPRLKSQEKYVCCVSHPDYIIYVVAAWTD